MMVPYGNETRQIRYRVVSYCNGLGLDLGCGGEKIVHTAIGIDQKQPSAANLLMDIGNLRIFSSEVFDFVYSSHAIEDMYYTEPCLREWWRVIRPNGYMILAFPDWEQYSDSKDVEYNDAHQNHLERRDVLRMLKPFAHAEVVLTEIIDRSQVLVLRKLSSRSKGEIVKRNRPKPEKSALLIRYGAFGDAVMVTPILRKFKEEGYHVSLNCADTCKTVFENNPFVDSIIQHQRDCVALQELPEYWKILGGQFDKVANLSGSIEQTMLLLEGNVPFGCSAHPRAYELGCEQCSQMQQSRDAALGDTNYYDKTMKIAGYPDAKNTRGELWFSHGEIVKARDLASKWKRKNHFVILWSITGSSHHKAYPYWGLAATEFCRRHPDVIIYTVGDDVARLAEVHDHPQIRPRSGEWTLRMSFIMSRYADLVIGGETGMMHAAAADAFNEYEQPIGKEPWKIVLLSHSSAKNLTATWNKTINLEPDRKEAPCYPCHQLHYSLESCPLKHFPMIVMPDHNQPLVILDEFTDAQLTPVCMSKGIAVGKLLNAMEEVYRSRNADKSHQSK